MYRFHTKKNDLGILDKFLPIQKKINKILNWKPKFNDIKTILLSSIKWEKENKLNG